MKEIRKFGEDEDIFGESSVNDEDEVDDFFEYQDTLNEYNFEDLEDEEGEDDESGLTNDDDSNWF